MPPTQLRQPLRRREPESSITAFSPDYTRWPALLPPISRSILGAAESSGAKLVFADNLYAYGPVDGPLREDLSPIASGPKGRTRVEVGEVWHLPAAEPLTAQQFFDLVFEAAGRPTPAKAQIMGRRCSPWRPSFADAPGAARDRLPVPATFVIDSSKFEDAFGRLEPTPHREAVERTVEWFRSR